MDKLTVYLPSDLLIRYAAMSQDTGRPKADLMREALQRYADQHQADLPDWIGALDDGAVNSENIDDWLHAHWKPV